MDPHLLDALSTLTFLTKTWFHISIFYELYRSIIDKSSLIIKRGKESKLISENIFKMTMTMIMMIRTVFRRTKKQIKIINPDLILQKKKV